MNEANAKLTPPSFVDTHRPGTAPTAAGPSRLVMPQYRHISSCVAKSLRKDLGITLFPLSQRK
jgi:hypothetical protein